jgi:hypothetical protein
MIQFIRKFFDGSIRNKPEPSSNRLKHTVTLYVDDAFLKAFHDLVELANISEKDVLLNALNLYDIAVKERINNNKGIVFQDLAPEENQ